MQSETISTALTTLFRELIQGVPRGPSFMLNTGDVGLVGSLDKLSAAEASRVHAGGSSIAAHVDHLWYGLSLMNRWHAGDPNPWKDADWTASWRRTAVSDEEWSRLRSALRHEAERWLEVLGDRRDMDVTRLTYTMSTIPHLAYHLGAIRQMNRAIGGPTAEEEVRLKAAR